MADFINENKTLLTKLGEDAWFIGSDAEQKLKEKIERIGKPLKVWDVNIYRGVLTGLNEAFIIDNETKERLCKEDPKSAEILKPVLGGKNLLRYNYKWAGLWLIASGYDIDVPKKYPAVFNHLKQFEEKAKKRDDQGVNWWNLRACAYYPEFEKEKVVWLNLNRKWKYSYVEPGIYVEASLNFISSKEKIKYFVALLSSKILLWYFKKIGRMHDSGGFMCKIDTMSNIPIPLITISNKKIVEQIESEVEEILKAKKYNPNADTSTLEREIDEMVYALYGLTPEEIAIVEGNR